MTAPVTTAIFSPAPAPHAASPASDANSADSDFSRILAEQRPDADAATDAGANAGSDAAANASSAQAAATNVHHDEGDDHDESAESAKPAAADAPLAALALAIAAQVAELQGAARGTTNADIDGASRAVHNNAHATPGRHDRSLARTHAADAPEASFRASANTPASDAPARLATALTEDAASRPGAVKGAHGLRPTIQTTTPRNARQTDLPTTARNALTATPSTPRDNAAAFTLNATHASANASPQNHDLLQTHQTLPASATEPGTPALPFFDAPARQHDAAPQFSPTPPAAISAPLASPEWNRELGQRLITLSRENGDTHSAELRLDPPELGPLRVTLTVTDGVAHAAFTSPHASVRHSIEAALEQLQATLTEAGIELGQASVSDQQQGQDAPPTPASPARVNHSTASTAPSNHAPAVRGDALVDAYV